VAREAHLGTGLEDWRAKLARLRDDLDALAAQQETRGDPALRARALATAALELESLAVALDRELRGFPERGSWADHVEAATGFLTRALQASPVLQALRATLERLRPLDGLGTASVSRADFRDAVRGLLAAAVRPETTDGPAVWLGSAAGLAGLDFELVCLAGVEEGEWPGGTTPDPLLLPHERAALAACLAWSGALDTSERRSRQARQLFWTWCAAARQRLVLFYARLDPTTGAASLPAAMTLELASRRSGCDIDYAGLESLPWFERVPLRRAAAAASGPGLGWDEIDMRAGLGLPPAVARRYVAGLGECARRGLGLDRLRHHVARFTSVDGVLTARPARAALAERYARPSFSATQLATYGTCPFRYFLRYVLRLEPLERDDAREVSDLETGRLVHHILEHFYRDLPAGGLTSLDDAAAGARLQAAMHAVLHEFEARGRTGARLLWDIRKQRLSEDLRHFVRAERERGAGPWQAEAHELRFGPGTARVPVVRGDRPGPIRLVGFIDRLDRDPRTGGLRIVDYKTGSMLPRKRSPRASQLAVYLFAATQGEAVVLDRSEACFAYVTRRGGFATQSLPGSVLRERRAEFEALVTGVAAGITAGEFFPHPGADGSHCKNCDFRMACDVRIAPQAQFKAAAGQTERLEALPDFASALVESSPQRGFASGRDTKEDDA
jgi:RecB family exonuclease